MSLVHLHLSTNHIPVIGILIGLLILATGVFWRSADIKRLILYYFVLLGAVTIVVYLTGEPAEEAVEKLAGVSEHAIEKHEEASIVALIAVELIAVLGLAGLAVRKAALAQRAWFWNLLLALTFMASGAMGWVANLGGKIRHTEIDAILDATGNTAQGRAREDDKSHLRK